jgi:hypothetical protein
MRRSVLVIAVLALSGCGGSEQRENRLRPPAPVTLTGAIHKTGLQISPASVGAGTIVLIVSNQSGVRQTVTFETEELGGSKPGLKQSTQPIGPRATTTLKADVREGTYAISTKSGDVSPATVKVGGPRKSAQDELLQP